MVVFIKKLHLGILEEFRQQNLLKFIMYPLIMMASYLISSFKRIIQVIGEEGVGSSDEMRDILNWI